MVSHCASVLGRMWYGLVGARNAKAFKMRWHSSRSAVSTGSQIAACMGCVGRLIGYRLQSGNGESKSVTSIKSQNDGFKEETSTSRL